MDWVGRGRGYDLESVGSAGSASRLSVVIAGGADNVTSLALSCPVVSVVGSANLATVVDTGVGRLYFEFA